MFKKIFLVIILYLYLFNPLFFFMGGIGSIKILYLLLLVLISSQVSSFGRDLKLFKKEKKFFIILLIYALFRTIIGGEMIEFYKHIILIIENFFIPLAIIFYAYKNSIQGKNEFFKLLLITGCLAAVISTACIVNPAIHEFVQYQLQVVDTSSFLYQSKSRGYGLCDVLTYSLGIIEGMILGWGFLNIKQYKWILYFSPLFLATIMLNARTGIIVCLFAVISYLLCSGFNFKRWIIAGFGSVTVYLLILLFLKIYGFSEEQMFFIMDFSNQVTEAEEWGVREQSGAIGALTTRHIVWPEGLDWIVGKGYVIFARAGSKNSDIGFFQQLNYGGLPYFVLLMWFISYIFLWMRKHKVSHDVILFMLIAFIIGNFKGNFIMNSGGFRLMILFFYVYKYYYHKGKEDYLRKI